MTLARRHDATWTIVWPTAIPSPDTPSRAHPMFRAFAGRSCRRPPLPLRPAGGSSAPTFSPDALPGLAAWYEARYVAGRAATRPADNTPIATWTDLGPNGLHLGQADATRRPRFVSQGAGGRPAVAFESASQQFLVLGQNLVPSGSPRTVFVAGRAQGTSGGALVCFRRTTPVFAGQLLNIGGTSYVYSDGVNGASNATGTYSLTSPFLVTMTSAGAGQKFGLRLNGAPVPVSQVGSCTAEGGTAGFLVGGREIPSLSWNGEIASVVVYGRLLGASEISAVEAYLQGA